MATTELKINERIDTCLSDLERKRQSVESFQARVRHLIDGLRTQGMTPGTVSSLLSALESVLNDYAEIGSSCHTMIESLRAIGDHLNQVEAGRARIITGVETILENLSHLDKLAQNGMQVGAASSTTPKRILLVRISPDEKGDDARGEANDSPRADGHGERDDVEPEEPEATPQSTVVH